MATILATKLHIPPPRPTLVVRPRLGDKLDSGRSSKLTLITAPAGSGKTTLLSMWIAAKDVRVAWLSLDKGDNDPTRFLGHLIATLRRVNNNFGKSVQGFLQAPQPPSLEPLLTALINELCEDVTPVYIALDDYHVLKSAAIHDALSFLLEHLPPTARVIITSRTDPPLPLARLRARGELNEVRAVDLRFTPEEAATFLNGAMSLNLSPEEISALETRTEGWVAGLQLAALAMQGRDDTSDFIAAFTGSHRYIVDYLIEDVLQQQPESVQTFLLQTSILERLTGPLCDAVMAGQDGSRMLGQLERSNLFINPLDNEWHWYRYHHLFAEVLRNRLWQVRAEQVPELHRRAARWLEHEGFITEAAEHALAAGDARWAIRLVETFADTLWPRGELTTVLMWVDKLPKEMLRLRPRLLLIGAWARFLLRSYNSKGVEELLAEAELALDNISRLDTSAGATQTGLPEGEAAELRGIMAAIRTAVASAKEDGFQTLTYAQEALIQLPEGNVLWRIVPVVSAGIAHSAIGDARAADQTLTEAITLCQATGNTYVAQVATMNLARVRMMQGKLHSAVELSERVLGMAGEQKKGRSPVIGYPHVFLGKLLYELNDLEGALQHLEMGLELAHADEHLRSLLDGYPALAQLLLVQGDMSGFEKAMRHAEEIAQAVTLPWAMPLVAAYRARFALWLGEVTTAIRWAEETGLTVDDPLEYPSEVAYITLARVRIAQKQLDQALYLLERLIRATETMGRWGSVLELLVVQALALQERENTRGALSVLQRALALAEPEGYFRLFLDEGEPMTALLRKASAQGISPTYTSKLLVMFGDPNAPSASETQTTQSKTGLLNERETSVLRFMAGRLSDKEIAKELSLSVSTVKWYSSRIYDKLGAHGRREAVTRARTLGLL